MNENLHEIRAVYDAHTIRVYQAFRADIANAALKRGTFVSPPFNMSRMTWIKPSFLWMMYRSGWGLKDLGQSRILAIDITREGFEWALSHGCFSHRDPAMNLEEWRAFKARHPVRIQWDPERDIFLRPLPFRSLQIGLEGEAVELYVNKWIRCIEDITKDAHQIHELIENDKLEEAKNLLPVERIYPVDNVPVSVASSRA